MHHGDLPAPFRLRPQILAIFVASLKAHITTWSNNRHEEYTMGTYIVRELIVVWGMSCSRGIMKITRHKPFF
jgi:hypothetical protein